MLVSTKDTTVFSVVVSTSLHLAIVPLELEGAKLTLDKVAA